MDGLFEVEVFGKTRGFKFGPRAVALAEREDGCKGGELFLKMADGDQLAILNMFYGAALDYCKIKNIKPDFNSSDVADWVSEIGYQQCLEIMTKGLQTYIGKNLSPPASPGANGQ